MSGDSEGESDDEGQSDVRILIMLTVSSFEPYVTTELKRAYKNRFRIGTLSWSTREEVFK